MHEIERKIFEAESKNQKHLQQSMRRLMRMKSEN